MGPEAIVYPVEEPRKGTVMDIGIITLWASNNYGGVLQAYATQTYLEQLGHRAFVVPAEYDRKKANWLKTLERPVKRVVDLLKDK